MSASWQLKSTENVAMGAMFEGGTVVSMVSEVSEMAAAVGKYCAMKTRMDSVLD